MNVDIITLEEKTVYGLWMNSSDKTISKDIKLLSEKYRNALSAEKLIPFFVLSRNYSEETKGFELFVGSTKECVDMSKLVLPKGDYAKITVKPKLGFFWGLSIGEAKRYFYQQWLPSSLFNGLNMEYEYHNEKTLGKHPTADIIFAVSKKVI
ncbi:MAG: GyrI-like domain-containing protein [Methanocorpusculum sp.]|nr:GyrI-like domain-containing protein [Methanocorpusculum sp.]